MSDAPAQNRRHAGPATRRPRAATGALPLGAAAVAATAALSAGFGTAWLSAGPAAAQLAREDAVMNRPREDYDPIGLPLPLPGSDPSVVGNTLLFPSLRLSSGFDDNVYRTADDETADFFATIAPELSVRTGDELLAFTLDLTAELRRYLEETDNDYLDAGVAGQMRASPLEDLDLRADAGWFRRHEDRADPDSAGLESSVTEYDEVQGGGEVIYRLSELQFLLDAEARDLSYSDSATVPGAFRDRIVYSTRGRVGYEFDAGLIAFTEGSYNWVRYDRDRDREGFLQDNEGWQVLAGLGYDLSGVSYAEVGVGYRQQSFDDPSFENSGGLAFSADVLWNVTDMMTLTLGASRSVEQTTLAGASSSVNTSIELGLDYEILYDLLFTSRLGYANADFGDIEREDDDITARAGLVYLINEFSSADLTYEFQRRESSAADADFTSNTVTLGVRLHY